MIDINTICVIGGDKRQIYMGLSFIRDGYNVIFYGVDKCTMVDEDYSSLRQAVSKSSCIVLPMPLTKDGVTLFTPLSDKKIPLDNTFSQLIRDKNIFCTNSRILKQTGDYTGARIYDYLDREELAVLNAVPTAEGAIEVAMSNYQRTINSSSCLVAGYGRIGKVLSRLLAALGANVTVSARNLNDLTWIRLNGHSAIHTDDIADSGRYDIIFNTVPTLIFDQKTLAKTAKNALVIDLASAPGGVDFDACDKLQIRAIHALSLPGKVAPVTAGEIIKNTICNMVKEGAG
ncbi:MAG: dipicolinate synthase subunit DpsA [Lachnospiraceae bacterium]|nr:dipicolinate synthase subunit DpsA [Lachnospiraceae bacterium]